MIEEEEEEEEEEWREEGSLSMVAFHGGVRAKGLCFVMCVLILVCWSYLWVHVRVFVTRCVHLLACAYMSSM